MMNFSSDLTWISDRYQSLFGQMAPRSDLLFMDLAVPILEAIARGDAPYHTVTHTLQVMRVGQVILEGKHHYEGTLFPQKWLQVMMSLLCHDIGYVKGILHQDKGDINVYSDGQGGWLKIIPTATGAALGDVHVNRGKAFISTHLNHASLDQKVIQWNIEMTRFPVPNHIAYQDMTNDSGLCRAADLIGQLSDPQYLRKLPALYREFEETGMNQVLGCASPEDLQSTYPNFFWQQVYRYVKPSLRYLTVTPEGRKHIARLYTNLCVAELNFSPGDHPPPPVRNPDCSHGTGVLTGGEIHLYGIPLTGKTPQRTVMGDPSSITIEDTED